MKAHCLFSEHNTKNTPGLKPCVEWCCGISKNFTFKEMNRRFLVRTHELATEKFVSKLLCLHKSTIFCHAYFVGGELNPFYEREKWKVWRARSSLQCKLFNHNNTIWAAAWNAQYLSDTGTKIYPADTWRRQQISKIHVTYQQHDRDQTESQDVIVENCFDQVGPRQHLVAATHTKANSLLN